MERASEPVITAPAAPWADTAETIASALASDLVNGLSAAAAASRRQRLGSNELSHTTQPSPGQLLGKQFSSPLIIILCLAALLTAGLGEWLDTAIISFAVLVNAALGFAQEYRAERAIAALQAYLHHEARVIRSGQEITIDARDIVPGDLLRVQSGERINADARIVRAVDCQVDEALLTGESLPVHKHADTLNPNTILADQTNMLFAGTLVTGGSVLALVTHTGARTQIGQLAALVDQTHTDATPLQRVLAKLTWVIIAVTTVLVAAVFFIGWHSGQPFYDMLVLSVAVLVGSVPEALPIGLTAILAVGVERIAKRKGIIRNLTASETLGSTTLIITDKTGTLTQATLQLRTIDNLATLLQPHSTTTSNHTYTAEERQLLRLASAACDVSLENPSDAPSAWQLTGSLLEQNIVRAAGHEHIILSPTDRQAITAFIPFSSKYKFSVTHVPSTFAHAGHRHIILGAPDVLLKRSTLNAAEQHIVQTAITQHGQAGHRVLGLAAYTPHTTTPNTADVTGVTFVGLLSFHDPIRTEVPDALQRIQAVGTRVVMATGDLPGTALAVARELGWDVDESHILTGTDVAALSDEALSAQLDHIRIFARVTPRDKLRITRLHQARGETVAMTGDGVNDAPSLKAANIGIAVGSGTDVAKSVADLVLLDNNFSTIVATIEEGKQILSNIKKMFIYLMSNALDELILVGGAIIAGVALPLSAMQIIWVNLFTGSVPAIAFAFDRQRLRETPDTARTLFDARVIFLTTSVGVIISGLLLALYLLLLQYGVVVETARTVLFAAFGFYTLLIAYSFIDLSRPIWQYNVLQNNVLNYGFLIGSTLMLVTLYLPFFQQQFAIVSLSWPWVAFVGGWLVLQVVIVEMLKAFANRVLVTYK